MKFYCALFGTVLFGAIFAFIGRFVFVYSEVVELPPEAVGDSVYGGFAFGWAGWGTSLETKIHAYDVDFMQSILVCLISLIWDVVVLGFHWVIPPHPKFRMISLRQVSIYTHIVAGSFEIIFSVVAFFLEPGTDTYTFFIYMQVFCAIAHSITAAYQAPAVFGIPCVMITSYMVVIAWKFFTAMSLLMDPSSVSLHKSLFFVHHIYVWCRSCHIMLEQIGIMEEYTYTLSIMIAGLICGPHTFGTAGNLFLISAIAVFGTIYLSWPGMTERTRDWWRTPREANLWLSNRFQASDTMDMLRKRLKEAQHMKPRERSKHQARAVFDAFQHSSETWHERERAFVQTDQHGEALTLEELRDILTSYGMPKKEVEYVFKERGGGDDGIISFEEFYKYLGALWKPLVNEKFIEAANKGVHFFSATDEKNNLRADLSKLIRNHTLERVQAQLNLAIKERDSKEKEGGNMNGVAVESKATAAKTAANTLTSATMETKMAPASVQSFKGVDDLPGQVGTSKSVVVADF